MPVYFDCQRCTACCRWPGQVRLREVDISAISAFLGLSEFDFIQQYTRLRLDRLGLALIDQPDGACIFLEGSNCRIQAVKPQQCLEFPNTWRFPGFDKFCQAQPRTVSEEEYRELLRQGSSPPEVR